MYLKENAVPKVATPPVRNIQMLPKKEKNSSIEISGLNRKDFEGLVENHVGWLTQSWSA